MNQFLTPYDLLRLKTRLGMTSEQFLAQYTIQHIGPQTGLPVITFKTDRSSNSTCPFVTESGCRVYEDRPSSCRMYPVVRVVSRSRECGKIEVHFTLLKEAHCLGHGQDKEQTIRGWLAEQELDVYNLYNDMLMEIIALKNRTEPGPLDVEACRRFHLALYDIDNFRKHVFKPKLWQDFTVDRSTFIKAQTNDAALLRIGHAWIK